MNDISEHCLCDHCSGKDCEIFTEEEKESNQKAHDAQVAKAEREQAETTDNILTVLKKRYRKEMAIVDYIEMIECEVESLRHQPEPQQEGRR